MKNNLVIALFFVVLTNYLGQEQISSHEIESHFYKSQDLKKEIVQNNNEEIFPLNKSYNQDLTKTVFGFYPYWEYSNNAHNNFRYDLLTHIAVFDFEINSNAGLSNPSGWPWTSFINTAHSNGIKVVMTITNFEVTKTQMHEVLTNALLRYTFIGNVKNILQTNKLDGVNIDFEGSHIDVADRGDNINNFMQELTDSVHSWDSDLEVSFASPAINWGGWELVGLANSCDYLFVMGYDFFGNWSSTTGPTAPLTSNTSYNVTKTIDVQYQTTSIFNPEKLILGVPYYGPHWESVNSSSGSAVIRFVNSVRFRDAQPEFNTFGTNWSTLYNNSWYNFLSGSTNHQVWIDNDSSLSLKYDLAISRNLKGVGMWALGFDGTRNELWDLLEEKFKTVVNVEKETKIPNEVVLRQNYPNPFNPSTTIDYTIPKFKGSNGSFVSLKIYNHLGSEVKTLTNIFQIAGNYSVKFNAENLSSGVYFYTLRAGDYKITKRMIFLK